MIATLTSEMNDLISSQNSDSGPVECLGQRFPNDQARREHYSRLLAEKLSHSDFRKLPGFPTASIEEILELSDPPYYTACPNPFIPDFISQNLTSAPDAVTNLPHVGDLEADARHPVFSFHPYHTKVPPEIIRKLINHYTRPGELILDAFSGTGMTGVAAREAGRNAILIDLSPVATFISGINSVSGPAIGAAVALGQIISESKRDLSWVYKTKLGNVESEANYYVWSDVFTCPECTHAFPFFPHGVVHHGNKVETRKSFSCPSCDADLNVRKVERVVTPAGKMRALVWVNAGTGVARQNREPNEFDFDIVRRIEQINPSVWFPKDQINPDGYSAKLAQLGDKQIRDISFFLSDRNRLVFADLWSRVQKISDAAVKNLAKSCLTSIFTVISERQGYFGGGGGMSGNLYMPIVRMEKNIFDSLERKIKKMIDAEGSKPRSTQRCLVSTQSATNLSLIDSSTIDYIYTDPPFGANIIYSEMNLILEGWLRVRSSESSEAVINESTGKTFDDYGALMRAVFLEYFRVLKPGRWITVEFHNTKASVWNLIQTGLGQAGFVVAQVGKLDKGSTTILADIRPGAVVQDLIISAYKPSAAIERKFELSGLTEESVWDFVEMHLRHVPVHQVKDGIIVFLTERSARIIYDRMIAWYIKHNAAVPVSSHELLAGMQARYAGRDGMFFLEDQVTEYDRARATVKDEPQLELFVSDERSAIEWLETFLKRRPSTYKEIHPEFVQQIAAGWKRHETRPELTALLENNFLKYDGTGDVPSQIQTYLSHNYREFRGLEKSAQALQAKGQDRWYVPDPNKAQDLEKRREKALLKEFDTYAATSGRKLKEFRLEVLRAGFKTAWGNRDYQTIIKVAQKIPEEALQEDEKLLLWYDQALTRAEAAA